MGIRILIVDDHEVVRRGLKTLFEDSKIQIIAEAANAEDAVSQAVEYEPDVVLLDLRMDEDGGGLKALDQMRTKLPESKVVILSTFDNPTYIARAVALGACDYVLKGSSRRDLIHAVEAAAEGRSPVKSGAMQSIAERMESRQLAGDDVPLTHRETQVLRHIALGLSNKEIALSLKISIETVKEHVQNILRKIDASDRTEAAVWAVRKQLV